MLTCSCCGKGIKDTPKENVAHGKEPYPCDKGYGWCKECYGDENAKNIKKKIGWAMCQYYEARFSLLRDALNTRNKKLWDSLAYWKKCYLIKSCVEEGYIKW